MLMAVDEDGDGLVSFTELVKSLGIKTHEMLQVEKQQKARRGEDDHSVEERYGYFATWLAGIDEFDRSQHHLQSLKAAKICDQYMSSTVRFPRNLHTLSGAEQTKIIRHAQFFSGAVRGEVDYSHVPLPLDTQLARGNLQSATAMRMATMKSYQISVACRHLPRNQHEIDPVVLVVRLPSEPRVYSCEEDRQSAKQDCVLDALFERFDQDAMHTTQAQNMRTERQENTKNPRFHRTLEWRLSTIGRLSELPKLLASEMLLFVVYDDPHPFRLNPCGGQDCIIGILECSLGEILSASTSDSGALVKTLSKWTQDSSGYADPMANGVIVIQAREKFDGLDPISRHLIEKARRQSMAGSEDDAAALEQVREEFIGTPSRPGRGNLLERDTSLERETSVYTPRAERWVAAFQQDVRSAFNALVGDMSEDTGKSEKSVRKQIDMTTFLGILEKTNILPIDTHTDDTQIQPKENAAEPHSRQHPKSFPLGILSKREAHKLFEKNHGKFGSIDLEQLMEICRDICDQLLRELKAHYRDKRANLCKRKQLQMIPRSLNDASKLSARRSVAISGPHPFLLHIRI
jgi:hypothetical protein